MALSKEPDSEALAEIWKKNVATHAANAAIRTELQALEEADCKTMKELSTLQFELRPLTDSLKKQEECLQAVFMPQSDLAEKSLRQFEEHGAEIRNLKEKIAALTHSSQRERVVHFEESINNSKETILKKYSNFENEATETK